jgi:hypothetical protein
MKVSEPEIIAGFVHFTFYPGGKIPSGILRR